MQQGPTCLKQTRPGERCPSLCDPRAKPIGYGLGESFACALAVGLRCTCPPRLSFGTCSTGPSDLQLPPSAPITPQRFVPTRINIPPPPARRRHTADMEVRGPAPPPSPQSLGRTDPRPDATCAEGCTAWCVLGLAKDQSTTSGKCRTGRHHHPHHHGNPSVTDWCTR